MMLEAARPVRRASPRRKYCESNFKVGPILKPDRPIVHCPNDANIFAYNRYNEVFQSHEFAIFQFLLLLPLTEYNSKVCGGAALCAS